MNPTKLILGLAGPFIAAGSGLLSAAAGKYGVHLDQTGVATLATAGATAGAAIVLKLIHDVETGAAKKDPKLVDYVKELEKKAFPVAEAAVKVDPQLAQAAKQAETAVVAKVESADKAAADALANAWPAEPAVAIPADTAIKVEPAPANAAVAVAPADPVTSAAVAPAAVATSQ